jgi:hypothetical protein
MEVLATRADLVRHRLSSTLAALDRRRKELVDLPLQITRHAKLVAVIAIGLSGLVAFGVYRAATPRRRLRDERWAMLRRAWVHPERVVRKQPSVLGSLARTLLLGAVRTLATRVLAEVLKNVTDRQHLALSDGVDSAPPPPDAQAGSVTAA